MQICVLGIGSKRGNPQASGRGGSLVKGLVGPESGQIGAIKAPQNSGHLAFEIPQKEGERLCLGESLIASRYGQKRPIGSYKKGNNTGGVPPGFQR